MSASVLQPDIHLVRRMLSDACAYSASKLGCPSTEIPERLRGGCPSSFTHLRYFLAKQLVSYLGSVDDRITAGYLFTNSAAEAKPNPNMSIVLRVSQNSPALSSLAKWFDAQLLAEYKRIVEPTAVPSRPLLDLYVVTEAEIAQRAGLAALIGSTHTQLLLLWERAS